MKMAQLPQRIGLALALFVAGGAAAQTNITFPDPNLEAAVLSTLHKTNGTVSTTDMLGLTNLTSSDPITNLSGLEFAANLRLLRLYNGTSASLAPLVGLSHLTTLCFKGSTPEVLAFLPALSQLTNLDLSMSSSLTNVTSLTSLTNLVILNLADNHITDCTPLSALPRLQSLNLSHNLVGDLSPLMSLRDLRWLYLHSTSLTNIQFVSGLTNLIKLGLSDNQLTDPSPLARLTRLVTLDLDRNALTNIQSLSGLTNLTELGLSDEFSFQLAAVAQQADHALNSN